MAKERDGGNTRGWATKSRRKVGLGRRLANFPAGRRWGAWSKLQSLDPGGQTAGQPQSLRAISGADGVGRFCLAGSVCLRIKTETAISERAPQTASGGCHLHPRMGWQRGDLGGFAGIGMQSEQPSCIPRSRRERFRKHSLLRRNAARGALQPARSHPGGGAMA